MLSSLCFTLRRQYLTGLPRPAFLKVPQLFVSRVVSLCGFHLQGVLIFKCGILY